MICYFHESDLDGKASAAIVKYRFPECKTVGVQYGDPLPIDTIKKDETVFIVDFSWDMVDMRKLADYCNLVWIDHHKTAMEAYEREKDLDIQGLRQDGIGACALVWRYLAFAKSIPPYGIQLLAEDDVWNHKNSNTLPFQFGMRLEVNSPDALIWKMLFEGGNEVVMDVCSRGDIILRYQKQSNEIYAGVSAFDLEFEGIRFIALNKTIGGSQLFDSVFDPDDHDAMLRFGWSNDGHWIVSMYALPGTIDVSHIAKKYGGGGHAGACGFTCKKLPFDFGGI